jgi:SAM-dependent methyltransferase
LPSEGPTRVFHPLAHHHAQRTCARLAALAFAPPHPGGGKTDGRKAIYRNRFTPTKQFDELSFRAWKEHFGAGSTEKYCDELFRIGGHPLVSQFNRRWHASQLLDELAILNATAATLTAQTKAVCDLGCGAGLITAVMGQFLPCRVVGVDRRRFWEHESKHLNSKLSENVEFKQNDVIEESPPDQFDILLVDGLKQHCKPGQFWQAINNWCCPNGFVLVCGGGLNASSAESLRVSLDRIYGFWPIACVPIGGPNSPLLPDDPDTLLVFQKMAPVADLSGQYRQLVGEFRAYCAEAESYLNNETIPYHQRTYTNYFLRKRSARAQGETTR